MQELARDSTLNMTINVYGRASYKRLRSAVERVGDAVLSKKKCVPSVYRNLDSIPEDLGKVIVAWDTLSTPVREAILCLVKNITPSGR